MSRFIDDYPFFGEPKHGAPATANILLSWLGVSFSPIDVQRAAVADWLRANEPLPRLAEELQARQLVEAASA